MNDRSTRMAPSPETRPLSTSHQVSAPVNSGGSVPPGLVAVEIESLGVREPLSSDDRLARWMALKSPLCAVIPAWLSFREGCRPFHKSKMGRKNGTHAHMIHTVGSNWLHTAIGHMEYVGSSRLYVLTAWMRMMLMMHTLGGLRERETERQGKSRDFHLQ